LSQLDLDLSISIFLRIWIRIQKATNLTDPTDVDPSTERQKSKPHLKGSDWLCMVVELKI